ncbi:nuclear body protein SP140-like, partial [Pteropus medius]|uniref:nuclear body protein SP140-like n=1 Tax=Pteropus vampyrus TaxID=132908 RepID=UPI00196A6835
MRCGHDPPPGRSRSLSLSVNILFLSSVSCELVDLERDEGGTSEEMPTLLPYDGEMTYDSEALQINNEGVLKKAISLTASEGEEDRNAFWEPCDGEETQEALYSSPRLEPVLCDPETPQMITKKERDEVASPALCDREVSVGIEALQRDREGESEELPSSLLPCDGQVSGGVDAVQMDIEEESEELPSSLLPCDGQETVDLGNNSTLGKPKRKRESRKLTDESVDFCSQILPVTCGAIKGMLYQNKLEQGSTVKCIQGEDGSWFTPQEFGVKGVCSGWNYWKDAVHCGGRRLRWLIKEGFLPNPPRIYSKGKK